MQSQLSLLTSYRPGEQRKNYWLTFETECSRYFPASSVLVSKAPWPVGLLKPPKQRLSPSLFISVSLSYVVEGRTLHRPWHAALFHSCYLRVGYYLRMVVLHFSAAKGWRQGVSWPSRTSHSIHQYGLSPIRERYFPRAWSESGSMVDQHCNSRYRNTEAVTSE
jgi:hypothetical protein